MFEYYGWIMILPAWQRMNREDVDRLCPTITREVKGGPMANKYDKIVEQLGGRFAYASISSYAPISEPQLAKFEAVLGCFLPADYREFLRDYGGFGFTGVMFPFHDNPDGVTMRSIDSFYGLRADEPDIVDDFREDMRSLGEMWDIETTLGIRLVKPVAEDVEGVAWPEELLPIAEDAGGNKICLALAGLRPGAIFFWVTAGNYGQNVYVVADSLDEFMHSLYISEY